MNDRRGRADRGRQVASRFEPLVTESQLSGSLAVTAETQLKAQVEELQRLLTFEVPRDPARNRTGCSLTPSRSRMRAGTPKLIGVSQSLAAGVDDVVTGEPAQQSTATTVTDQQGAAARAETAPRDTP